MLFKIEFRKSVYMGREKKERNTINPVNQRETIYSKKKKSIAVTIKMMMNAKEQRKAVGDAKYTGARTEQHTHTHIRAIKLINKSTFLIKEKQTNTQID
jgi:hypothetical protein